MMSTCPRPGYRSMLLIRFFVNAFVQMISFLALNVIWVVGLFCCIVMFMLFGFCSSKCVMFAPLIMLIPFFCAYCNSVVISFPVSNCPSKLFFIIALTCCWLNPNGFMLLFACWNGFRFSIGFSNWFISSNLLSRCSCCWLISS